LSKKKIKDRKTYNKNKMILKSYNKKLTILLKPEKNNKNSEIKCQMKKIIKNKKYIVII